MTFLLRVQKGHNHPSVIHLKIKTSSGSIFVQIRKGIEKHFFQIEVHFNSSCRIIFLRLVICPAPHIHQLDIHVFTSVEVTCQFSYYRHDLDMSHKV